MKKVIYSLILFTGLVATAAVIPIDEIFEPAGDFPKEQFVKVAVVAWVGGIAPLQEAGESDSSYQKRVDSFKQENRESLANYIRQAAQNGAEVVITPEFGTVGYPDHPDIPDEEDNFISPEEVSPYAENVDGPSTKYFSKLAKELGVYIHFGMVEGSQKKFYNTVVVIGPGGELVTSYRKIHLFNVEHNFLAEGDEIKTYDGPAGKVGIIICSDVYSSFPMDDYKNAKVDVMALSTSWAQYNSGWGFFVSGAKRTSAYLLAANQTYYPDSGVINPDGSTQSHIRQSEGIAYGYLPRKTK